MNYRPEKFSDISDSHLGKALWKFLNRDVIIARMETAVDLGKPAAEAVARKLAEEFGDDVKVGRVKQMIGHMIRQVMESRGYEIDIQNVKVLADKRLFVKATRYKDGTGATTKKGYVNRNNQLNLGHTERPGTDHNALAYKLKCNLCEKTYWANGTDVFQRKCPYCQGGSPGLDI